MARESQGLRLCPFSWIETTRPPGCLGQLLGQGSKNVFEPQRCMADSCQLWDAAAGNCGLITRK